MLILYTGSGKGKTTAAFGLALRAAGYGKMVRIIQFVKQESWPEGARLAIRKNLKNIHISAIGEGFIGIMGDSKPLSVHKKAAKLALSEVEKAIKSSHYDIIILDELLAALHAKLITKTDIIRVIASEAKQSSPDLLITGRAAPQWLIDLSDLVTEMREIKHPFQKGLKAKKGIDY